MLVTIFYHIDEFCKIFEKALKERVLERNIKPKKQRKSSLTLSEIMTICVYYHYSGYKNFKTYYKNYVLVHMKNDFKKLVSYNRFVELKANAALPLLLLMSRNLSNLTEAGIFFVDSSALSVCHNRRISSHKVFKNIAQRGHTSVGWFFGFKIHLIVNHLGEIVRFGITSGNVSDVSVLEKLVRDLKGKLFGDKGYITNKDLFAKLYKQGIQVITKIRKNMKNVLMPMRDKFLLQKRGIVESVVGILKNTFEIEHSRHRSPTNFIVHVLSTVIAYQLRPQKPSLVLPIQCLC